MEIFAGSQFILMTLSTGLACTLDSRSSSLCSRQGLRPGSYLHPSREQHWDSYFVRVLENKEETKVKSCQLMLNKLASPNYFKLFYWNRLNFYNYISQFCPLSLASSLLNTTQIWAHLQFNKNRFWNLETLRLITVFYFA